MPPLRGGERGKEERAGPCRATGGDEDTHRTEVGGISQNCRPWRTLCLTVLVSPARTEYARCVPGVQKSSRLTAIHEKHSK